MSRIILFLWPYAVAWVVSALLHVADSDVAGVRGLGELSVLVSVSVVALVFLAPAWLCRLAFARARWAGYLGAVLGFAALYGVVIGLLGYGGGTEGSRLPAIGGVSLLVGVAIMIASLPLVRLRLLR